MNDALLRIAEILAVLGAAPTEAAFSQTFLGKKAGFFGKIIQGKQYVVPMEVMEHLKLALELEHSLAADAVAEVLDKEARWIAHARYNLVQMAIKHFDQMVNTSNGIVCSISI